MPIHILMPALSPTMEKGNLAKWLKKEGDKVRPGDVLAEIETDKATMEYEAVDEGVLAKILVPAGAKDIPVNQPIAILAAEGEELQNIAAAAAMAREGTPAARAVPTEGAPAPAAPALAPTAAPAEVAPQALERPGETKRIFASPLARRLAREAGIDIARVQGSGPHGRVIARDIETAKASLIAPAQAPAVPPGAALAAEVPSDEKIRALFEPDSYELVPHDNMRRIIAQRLLQAKRTIPHFYLSMTCTLDKLLAAREDLNATAPRGEDGLPVWKLSVNDFIIKAMALALMKVKEANVTWTEGGMLKHKYADIGVAVAIPGGLITPVIRRAETKSLTAISTEMKDLAARARARKLLPHEYQGGSTAISNLGMYGVEEFAAVINPPHATILAVGMAEERPVVREGKVVVATQMKVTLSTDHRAVDGALGAELLSAFKSYIENPIRMLA